MLDSLPRGRGFEPHCLVSLSKNINRSQELVQPRKTRPFITDRLLMGRQDQIKQTLCCIDDRSKNSFKEGIMGNIHVKFNEIGPVVQEMWFKEKV